MSARVDPPGSGIDQLDEVAGDIDGGHQFITGVIFILQCIVHGEKRAVEIGLL